MAENSIGKFVIELDENDRKLLERFANAVELGQPPTIDWNMPKVRAVGVDELGNIKWEPAGETMTDLDRISTRQLNRLRRRILLVYGTARREMTEQLTEFLEHYQKLDAYKRAQLEAGKITESDYRTWLRNQVFQSEMMHQKLDNITQTCTTAQQTAYKLARDEQYDIFALGANWAFYELEQAAGVAFNLTLYNTEAVKRLLLENPKLVPNKRIKSESNKTYDARVFNRYVTKGIIQGKSVHDIAVQAVQGMADTEVHWAMNNAITALTGAQNAGTMQQLRNAEAIGIEVQKRWNSTLDYRTREMHRLLDQETADLDEPFKVQGYEIQYPGDPNAAPEMVYHCRCKLSSALVKYPRQNAIRRENIITLEDTGMVNAKGKPIKVRTKKAVSEMTYTEWYKAKGGTEKEQMWWAEERKRRKESSKNE